MAQYCEKREELVSSRLAEVGPQGTEMKRAAVLLSLFAFACGPDAGAGAGSGSAKASSSAAKPASAKPSASASAATSAAPDDKKGGKMSNCPSGVANAKTDIKDTDKGVEITVTASEKADIEEIKARAKKLEEHGKSPSEADKGSHSGKGGGGGGMGRCPVVLNDTNVTVAVVDTGAKFTVEPKDVKELEWLRRESKERLAEMGMDKGERKMANCPSSVKDAKTSVKEAGATVVVTIVSKDAASTKEIRERAKKLSDGKHDQKGKHDGAGSGPQAGQCPAAIEGTTAAVKEVEGGVEITLTPAKKEELKKVLEEAQARAKPFE